MQQKLLNNLGSDFWQSLGLEGMPDNDDKNSLMLHIYSEAQKRVATRLMDNLNQDQLGEFERLVNNGDENQTIFWFKQNCPGYASIVKNEILKIKEEVSNYPHKQYIIQGN